MAVNPDPKPGRWILPLVILGMVAFTYFFIRELPAASPDSTIASGSTSTTVPNGEETTTTVPQSEVDPAVQAYLDALDQVNSSLQLLRTEMVTVNDGFDADPREIEYGDAESRMETIATDTDALADQVAQMTVPPGLETNHQALTTAIDFAAGAANDALDGLRSSDEGEVRRAAVVAFTQSADDFSTEVTNAKAAAGVPTEG